MCREAVISFVTSRVACMHRLRPEHVPRGLDHEDVMLPCKHDPDCPERNKKTVARRRKKR